VNLVSQAILDRFDKGVNSNVAEPLVVHSLTAEGHDASEDGAGRGTPLVPMAFQHKASISQTMNPSEVCPTIGASKEPAVAYQCQGTNVGPLGTLRSGNGTVTGGVPFVSQFGVRRLLPVECCRLQGFPDDWLDDLGLSNSAKYRMLGNAVAVPVAQWIGERLIACQ